MTAFLHKLINTKQGVLVLPRVDVITNIHLPEPDVRAESSVQEFPLGAALIADDGVFRYAKCGGSAVTIGKLLQQAVVTTGHTKDLAVAANASVGDTSVTITNSTTDITANMYKDGSLFVNDAAGEGAVYKIKSHPASTATDADVVITLVDPLEVALTTSSEVGLRKNLYDGVIVMPTTPTGVPVGYVNHSSFTSEYYAWIKTKGIVAALTAGTVVVGNRVVPLTTAGAVGPSSNDTLPTVGIVQSVASSTEYSLIKCDLDPSW